MTKRIYPSQQDEELPSDDWVLPLPDDLQAIVDSAPQDSCEALDAYVTRCVNDLWSDAAARDWTFAAYYQRKLQLSTKHLPDEVFRNSGYLGAELRVLREKVKRKARK